MCLGVKSCSAVLGGEDVAARVAAHVDDQSVRRQQRNEAQQLADEDVGIAVEGPDAQVPHRAARRLQRLHAQRVGNLRLDRRCGEAAAARAAGDRDGARRRRRRLADQRLRCEQQHLRQPRRRRRRVDGARTAQQLRATALRAAVEQRRHRAGIDDLPRHAHFPRPADRIAGSVRLAVADGDPLLVGRRAELHRAEGQAHHRRGAHAVGAAGAFLVGVAHHGAVDRHAVPVLDHDAGDEARVEPLADLGDDVGRRGIRPVHLDEKRQRRDLAGERRRPGVAGVVVAQLRHDRRQLDVESVVVERAHLGAEDSQPLHRIEAVARALQRQMGVDAADHRLERGEDAQPLGGRERRRRGQGRLRRVARGRGLAAPRRLGRGAARARPRAPRLLRFRRGAARHRFGERNALLGVGESCVGHPVLPWRLA